MDFDLTEERQRTVARARKVAMECLEPRAARYDESAGHPTESWRDLWRNGFLAAAVPRKHGGMGLDMLTYLIVVETLAQGCASTAMTFHMHSVVQRYIDALVTTEQKRSFYPDVVNGGKLFGSWGSEPERRGSIGVVGTVISPTDGGYLINGKKHFCTMAGAAHRYLVHCTTQDTDGSQGLQMALIPHYAAGMRITGGCDTLGMRGTVSPSVSFDDCFVSADSLLGAPGLADRVGVGQGFGLGYAAVYIGAAQKGLDFTADYCQGHRFDPDPRPLSHGVTIQRNVARMTMALEGARLVLYRSAGRWEHAPPAARWVLATRAKRLAADVTLMVISTVVQTVGGRSADRRFPLERLFRDVRTATLMPPNADRSMELIGKAAMGVEDRAFDPD